MVATLATTASFCTWVMANSRMVGITRKKMPPRIIIGIQKSRASMSCLSSVRAMVHTRLGLRRMGGLTEALTRPVGRARGVAGAVTIRLRSRWG